MSLYFCLGVGGAGPIPANALTLEEIHVRENIHPSTGQDSVANDSSGQGMVAFNRLIAAMESTKTPEGAKEVHILVVCSVRS